MVVSCKNTKSSKNLAIDDLMIRQVEQSDLVALEWGGKYKHFRKVFLNAYHRARGGTAVLWAAEIPQAGIIGQAFVQLVSERPELADGATKAYVYSVRIKPAYRNQGIGSLLMKHLENDLKERGYQFVTLNVAKTNQSARRLYERLGFRVIAYEPGEWSYPDHRGVWQDVIEPAWRMEKTL